MARPDGRLRSVALRAGVVPAGVVPAGVVPAGVVRAGSVLAPRDYFALLAYLPPEHAVEGSDALAVEYMNERFPVTVAIAGATALFDPENERIRS